MHRTLNVSLSPWILILTALDIDCTPHQAQAVSITNPFNLGLPAADFRGSARVAAAPAPVPAPGPAAPTPVVIFQVLTPVPVPAPVHVPVTVSVSVPVPTTIPGAAPLSTATISPAPCPCPVPSPLPSPSPSPSPVNIQCTTALEFLRGRGGFQFFLNAIETAGLTRYLTTRTAVQTLFAPTDTAFATLLQQQGIRQSQLLSQTEKLQRILQNHFLPNVQVKVADMVIGASWPTLNANELLTVAGPVTNAIIGADLQACNTLIQENSVVLVPQNVLPLGPGGSAAAGAATTAAAAPVTTQQLLVPVTVAAVPAPAPSPGSIPATFSSSLDVTKVNLNTG